MTIRQRKTLMGFKEKHQKYEDKIDRMLFKVGESKYTFLWVVLALILLAYLLWKI